MSTMGIDPFDLKQWELDTKIEDSHRRNGHGWGYDSPSRARKPTGFDRVESYEGEPRPRLELRYLLQRQRDEGNSRFYGSDMLPKGHNLHPCVPRPTDFYMDNSYNLHWHRRQAEESRHRSRR